MFMYNEVKLEKRTWHMTSSNKVKNRLSEFNEL